MPIAGLFNQLRCEFIPNDTEFKAHSSCHSSKLLTSNISMRLNTLIDTPLFEFFSVDFCRFDDPSLNPPVLIISVRSYTPRKDTGHINIYDLQFYFEGVLLSDK